MVPWGNDRVRFLYFAGIKPGFQGKTFDSKDISKLHININNKEERKLLDDTIDLNLKRSSIYNQELRFDYKPHYLKGLRTTFIVFHTEEGGKDVYDDWKFLTHKEWNDFWFNEKET